MTACFYQSYLGDDVISGIIIAIHGFLDFQRRLIPKKLISVAKARISQTLQPREKKHAYSIYFFRLQFTINVNI